MVYSIDKKILLKIYKKIFLIRETEEKIAREYKKQEMRCPVHLSIGQEAVPSVLSCFLSKKDIAVSSHRGHAHYLAKGGSLKRMIAEIYGKSTGCSKGKGGSMHLIDKSAGFFGSSAIVGNSIPVGLGLAYKFLLKKQKNISVVYLGDGAVEEGVFYETLNFAAVKKIPTLFICENNLYSVYSPLNVRQPGNRNICNMVKEIGVKAFEADGNSVKQIFNLCKKSIDQMKKNSEPCFLLFNTYRWREHCGPDYDNHIGYRTTSEFKNWKKKDPIKDIKKLLLNQKISANIINKIEKEVSKEILSAFSFAKISKFPSQKELMKDVLK